MAFWGVEVKPWKPFVHSTEKTRGRLRISQATLGTGGSKEKSVVQCNVGNRSPVLLCVLLPNQTESCHLDIEFEEADDVLFSVIGPRSVYLTGYYVSKSCHYNPHSDTESYGVDIDHSPSEKSSYCSEDDKYEDSFIDDDDELHSRSPSPVLSGKEVDVSTPEGDNIKNRNRRGKRLRKKNQVVESDDESEDEDEDGYLLSVFKRKKLINENSTSAGENIAQATDIAEQPKREKARKKRKEREEEKTFEVLNEGTDLGSGDCKETKIIRNEPQLEGTFTEGPYAKCHDNRDEPPENEDKKLKTDNNVRTISEPLENANQPDRKIKKNKSEKTQLEGDLQSIFPSTMDDYETISMNVEDHTRNEKTVPKRTLSNGLIIEELANGPPDGKVAALGKKVKIYYTAMVMENGLIFDSNVGKNAFKFRLGDEGIIEGLNLGIDGMHVGDKRRLVVPPSMGFGKHGAAENVPGDSWLVYDVKLAGVRK